VLIAMKTISLADRTDQYKPSAGALARIARALNTQIRRDFAPHWGVAPVKVTVGGRGQPVYFFDGAKQADDGWGFHDVDPHGNPYARVFVSPSIDNGSDWLSGEYPVSATASHEVLEMLGDQNANTFAFDGRRRLWACEMCDAVEAGTYKIGGVPVSNFVLRAYFNAHSRGPYDHQGRLRKPFTIDHGGYAIVEKASKESDVARERRGFTVDFGPGVPEWRKRLKLTPGTRTSWLLVLNMPDSNA
jgi:hypothetical protein